MSQASAPSVRCRRRWLTVARAVIGTALVAAPHIVAGEGADTASEVAVKAAFLHNFAKFAEWPSLPAGAPIVSCIVSDDGLAAALSERVRGQSINGHLLDVQRPQDSAIWHACHLLFIAAADTRRSAGGLAGIRTLPVLTVSDGNGFSQAGGIIELYIENRLMRFRINVDALKLSGMHLSSRLLGLANITRDTGKP
jgi:hypothetical protein